MDVLTRARSEQGNVPVAGDVDTKEGSVKLGPAALDAYRVSMTSLCLMVLHLL